ncbi:cytochrome P450 [Ktedonobacter robiniae]|uniref:Cytochrome P450 YjiB n=1 Tax=Ktedonobacter robiniae TaxID=2778365 RepID=A0ABQ3V442_9CHLR|nr:cytochrome P450 [Ktedonobacter robiniae]GHO59713.1 putative cytochrome P450 YjiB [Ktedonobacter robiniae]
MQQPQTHRGARGFAPFRVNTLTEVLQSYDWFEQMRTSSPVYQDEQTHLWQVFRYADVQKVATDYQHFSSEAVPGFSEDSFLRDTVVAKDPPDHRKLRNLVNVAFTPRAVSRLDGLVAQITQELLDEALPLGKMDVVSDIAFPLPAKVIAEMLGVPREDWDIFRRWAISEPTEQVNSREEALRARQAMGQQMHDYFVGLLAERRRSPREDLITSLSRAEIDGEHLSEDELVNFCLLLLAAGQETTKNLIANAILCFTENPEAMQRLIAEPALMPAAIEEVLRYLAPVWFLFRRTTTEVELGGQRIPANSIVLPWLASANRDPEQFPDPNRFDIQREPNRHLGFGHGIHFCIGAPLARLEARIALPMMLARLKNIQRVPDFPITVRTGVVFVIQSLPITFVAS